MRGSTSHEGCLSASRRCFHPPRSVFLSPLVASSLRGLSLCLPPLLLGSEECLSAFPRCFQPLRSVTLPPPVASSLRGLSFCFPRCFQPPRSVSLPPPVVSSLRGLFLCLPPLLPGSEVCLSASHRCFQLPKRSPVRVVPSVLQLVSSLSGKSKRVSWMVWHVPFQRLLSPFSERNFTRLSSIWRLGYGLNNR
jgi:hypothetical protein